MVNDGHSWKIHEAKSNPSERTSQEVKNHNVLNPTPDNQPRSRQPNGGKQSTHQCGTSVAKNVQKEGGQWP